MAVCDEAMTEVYLQPGEAYLASEPAILSTLLGSCVGVTFWSKRLGIGALSHAMMPRCPERDNARLEPQQGYRYVDYAIRTLARRLDACGVRREELEVKLFGGADVLPTSSKGRELQTIGELNCAAAHAILRAEGLHVTASSLRGEVGVKIHFNTANGEVWLQRILPSAVRVAENGRNRRAMA